MVAGKGDMDMTPAQKLIKDFMADTKVEFFNSSVDGTLCVEWLEMGVWKRSTVVDLGRRIMSFKRRRAKGMAW